MYVADAAPPLTVPVVAGPPICTAPLNTVNVTIPAFTVPPVLVTVAFSVTFWFDRLNVADALDAVVVLPAFTVRVAVLLPGPAVVVCVVVTPEVVLLLPPTFELVTSNVT